MLEAQGCLSPCYGNLHKTKGENIDNQNIKKHKNDVLRLAVSNKKETVIGIAERIKEDVPVSCRRLKKN